MAGRPAPNSSCGWRGTARIIRRLDRDTGEVVEFRMPYSDNGMRVFFLDKDAHIWYGSPPNNRAGYFYVSTRQRSADAR